MDIPLAKVKGQWVVDDTALVGPCYDANTVPEDAEIAALVRPAHDKVLDYVNSVIGTSKQAMSAATSRYEDTAAMDFINYVQADAVKKALAGTPTDHAGPVDRGAVQQGRGDPGRRRHRARRGRAVHLRQHLAGHQVHRRPGAAYLEYSAHYFKTVTSAGPFPADAVTNAVDRDGTERHPRLQLRHHGRARRPADVRHRHRPAGRQPHQEPPVCGCSGDGDQAFIIAINNYRQSGGGNFPGVTTAPVVYNAQVEIRQLLIDWVTANKVIDSSLFSTLDWKLVANGQPVTITG